MKNIGKLLAMTCVVVCSMAMADKSTNNERLNIDPPEGWKLGWEDKSNPKMLMHEYVKADQNIDNWSEMVTIQTFKGLKTLTPEQMLAQLAGLSQKACDGHGIQQIPFSDSDGYQTLGMIQGCGNNRTTNKGEVTLFRAIKGDKNMYLVQKAWKVEKFNPQQGIPVDKGSVTSAIKYLGTAKVCSTDKSKCN